MPVYLITYLLLFWLPVVVMGFWLLPKMGPSARKAFWLTLAIMTAATFVMEYV